MANFIALIDPDPCRRVRFDRAAREAVVHFPGMQVRQVACGDFVLVWAAHARAPGSQAQGPESAAMVLGDAIDGPGTRRLTATELAARSWRGPDDIPGPSDGYFVALQYAATQGLRVWTDVLGFFPVYYWTDGVVLLVGSSPALFRLHPSFRVELSREGLGGVLLTNGLVDNNTLLAGVRRLAAGHVLVAAEGDVPVGEREQYRIPLSHDLADLAFDDLLDDFGDIMERVIRRQSGPAGTGTVLLSGGLDSRLILGSGLRAGCALTAATFGRPGEQELVIASKVTRSLGLSHHVLDDTAADPAACAVAKARWEMLASGFFRGTCWGVHPGLAELPQPVLTGYALDFLAGPKRMHMERIARSGGDPFLRSFDRQCRWGIGPGHLDALLGRDGLRAGLERALRSHFESLSPYPAKRHLAHSMRHRARFHLGGVAWEIAMVSWPALPVLDRELLNLIGNAPMVALSGRRLEAELAITRFPRLAALPLDRNSHDTRPLNPRLVQLMAEALRRRVPWKPRLKPLYYDRLADLNGPEWMAVRQAAERERARAASVLDAGTLSRLLPDPSQRVVHKDMTVNGNGHRLLLGTLLWMREYLA